MASLHSSAVCRCGSRQFHSLDFMQAGYFLICESKLHATRVGDPFVPRPDDFFCPCGGFFACRIQTVWRGEGQPMVQDFCCPLCFITLRVADADVAGVVEALELRDALVLRHPRAERFVELAESLMDHRPERTGFGIMFRRMLFGVGDLPTPNRDHPLCLEFQNLVDQLRDLDG